MDADLETRLQPPGELFNKLLAEVAPMPRTAFLERMVQVRSRNLRDVDGVSAKVKEVMGNQGEAVVPADFRFGVDAVAAVSPAILVERDCPA